MFFMLLILFYCAGQNNPLSPEGSLPDDGAPKHVIICIENSVLTFFNKQTFTIQNKKKKKTRKVVTPV